MTFMDVVTRAVEGALADEFAIYPIDILFVAMAIVLGILLCLYTDRDK